MVVSFLAIVAWLALGHAVLAALFWGLLQVPESTVFMVALSALLVALFLVVAAWVEVFALLRSHAVHRTGGAGSSAAAGGAGSDGTTGGAGPAPANKEAGRIQTMVRAVPAFLVALAVFGVFFGATGRAAAWLTAHRGEIDAWMIAHLKTVRTAPLHATLAWILWFVRCGLGLSISLAVLQQLATCGLGSLRRFTWLAAGLRPARVALVALWILVFVWLPWQGVYWRPRSLPPTWLEPAFVTAKLLVIYVLANVGWALALRTAGKTVDSSQ
jgi:hypothetical protein